MTEDDKKAKEEEKVILNANDQLDFLLQEPL